MAQLKVESRSYRSDAGRKNRKIRCGKSVIITLLLNTT
jgi:hypothetical protein